MSNADSFPRHPLTSPSVSPSSSGPSSCTFLDEMWRSQTAKSQGHHYARTKEGTLVPSTYVPIFDPVPPRNIPPRTAAERASVEDTQLWGTSADVDDYEVRKEGLFAARKAEREEWLRTQRTFHGFVNLPPELRASIWQMAVRNYTTEVSVTVTRYEVKNPPPGSWCGTQSIRPIEVAATAYLPPFMLVCREAHDIAAKHYKRAFRGVSGRGGVLAGYPTSLQVERRAFGLLCLDEIDIVADCTVVDDSPWILHSGDQRPLRAILSAPKLRKFVVKTPSFAPEKKTPYLCAAIRREYVQATKDMKKKQRNVPQVEIVITPTKGEVYRFEGSILDLPKDW
ncbi:hypothetical protein F4777DRAFT_563343 [Nemania sp. FL0916]|nr:hypothetical protein F4777DRAFT_563343 [Nemania sp. FL0916]